MIPSSVGHRRGTAWSKWELARSNWQSTSMNLNELIPRAVEAETFLKALGNRQRLMILCELHKHELPVSAIHAVLGLSQSALSQHLARLRKDKLVQTRRESQTIYYSLAGDNVAKTIAFLYDMYCGPDATPKNTKAI